MYIQRCHASPVASVLKLGSIGLVTCVFQPLTSCMLHAGYCILLRIC